MSRQEIVVLVSRTLMVIEAVAAFIQISYFPEYLVSFMHYLEELGLQATPASRELYAHFLTTSSIALAFLVLRIGVLLMLTLLFWRCGPAVSKFLLPQSEEAQDSAQPA